MIKKFERMFGSSEAIASAKKMLTIFVMVASLALVAMLASIQTQSAQADIITLKPCETVQITNPKAGSSLNGVVTMTGYAAYGGSTCIVFVSGSQLTWFVNGVNLGHGNSKSFDFSPYFVCQGVYITLKAIIPTPSPHTISKTIVVKGSQPC